MHRLLRKKRSPLKTIIMVIVGFILIFSIISMIIVKVIYDAQFPRHNRHDETITAGLRYIELQAEYPRERVYFQSGENRLQGYVYGQHLDQGLVVVVHGLGGGADAYLSQITYFVDQGWRVFAYDATGSFDSEGKSTKGFPQQLLDLRAALEYISGEPAFSNLPILLFGHSWGGYAVANILHYDYDIAGVATISGPNSAMDMIMEQGRRMMGGFAYTQYPYLWLYQTILFGEAASFTAVDAMNRSNAPVLIIHGVEDDTVQYHGSSIISNVAHITNSKVEMITLNEPGHSGHNNLFRSNAALAYIDEINIVYRNLYDRYNKNIPYEVKQAFYSDINRNLANDINRGLMDEIHTFFIGCLR